MSGPGGAVAERGRVAGPQAGWPGLALAGALWLGILFDWLLGLAGTVAPEATVARLGPPLGPAERAWAAFAFYLTLLVSCFFVPGALDAGRYRVSVWLATGARLTEAAFFLLLYPQQYPTLGVAYLFLFAALVAAQAPQYLAQRRA
jgi:hypothetical protein